MNLLALFKSMPLASLTLLLPLLGAAVIGIVLLCNRLFSKRKEATMPRIAYKLPFFLLLVAGFVLSWVLWRHAASASAATYAFDGAQWSGVLADIGSVRGLMRVDAFGAISAFLMSFVAMTAGVRALADRDNTITPMKVIFFLLTCAGVQGIFYLNGLFAIFLSLMVAQAGVTGLYSGFRDHGPTRAATVCYYVSRVILLIMFIGGALMLRIKYGTDNVTMLAQTIEPNTVTLWAFILLATPMLYIFMKPSPYVPDAARICFFGIRTQASLFVFFRVLFSLYGPMRGLQKVPVLFMILGLVLALAALMLSCDAHDPKRFMGAMIFYIKGAVLTAVGIAMHGSFSAERAALYGVSALESMISQWLVFLPVSAALAIITVYLKQESGGHELWKEGRLFEAIPFTLFCIFTVIAVMAGLPPFIGYGGRQLLFRSANFISPFVFAATFLFTVMMLFTGLRFLLHLTAERERHRSEYYFRGESSIALPLMLLVALFTVMTIFPGAVFEQAVAPSAVSLMNRVIPSAITAPAAEPASSEDIPVRTDEDADAESDASEDSAEAPEEADEQ